MDSIGASSAHRRLHHPTQGGPRRREKKRWRLQFTRTAIVRNHRSECQAFAWTSASLILASLADSSSEWNVTGLDIIAVGQHETETGCASKYWRTKDGRFIEYGAQTGSKSGA